MNYISNHLCQQKMRKCKNSTEFQRYHYYVTLPPIHKLAPLAISDRNSSYIHLTCLPPTKVKWLLISSTWNAVHGMTKHNAALKIQTRRAFLKLQFFKLSQACRTSCDFKGPKLNTKRWDSPPQIESSTQQASPKWTASSSCWKNI